jgi:hypothetical protein
MAVLSLVWFVLRCSCSWVCFICSATHVQYFNYLFVKLVFVVPLVANFLFVQQHHSYFFHDLVQKFDSSKLAATTHHWNAISMFHVWYLSKKMFHVWLVNNSFMVGNAFVHDLMSSPFSSNFLMRFLKIAYCNLSRWIPSIWKCQKLGCLF